ncbi:rab-6.1 [Symbiodinium sp. CCMP2456]|nr:rab-6.1 [Symbiodinium sp. CCMP2456]
MDVSLQQRELVEQVKIWFTCTEMEALVQTAVQFADAHCAVFEPELGEHKLEYTRLHNEFKQLFEDRLNAFLSSIGATPEAFYEAFEKIGTEEGGEVQGLAEIMYTCLQYDFFCQIMCERKREMEMQQATGVLPTPPPAPPGGYVGAEGYCAGAPLVVFLGQCGTGKTALIRQFVHRTFDQNYTATIGMDFVGKLLSLEGRQLRLQLWDTAGQERFRALMPSYLRDSSACVVVYDVTSKESFDSIRGWVDLALEGRSRRDLLLVLVGNKIDLEAQRCVQKAEGEALAEDLKMLFFEATAKDATLVDAIFYGLAEGLTSEQHKPESDDEIVLTAPPRRREVHDRNKKCC